MGARGAVSYSCEAICDKEVYVDDNWAIYACRRVYEPAEDTWLALEAVEELVRENSVYLCVDVGAGTGVLGLRCSMHSGYTILIDVSPCAVYCSRLNSRRMGVDALVDVVQCDNISCIRCPGRESVFVYNTPYLPVEDEGLEGLAWSGGIREARRLAGQASACTGLSCVVLVYSSLSGSDKDVVDSLRGAGIAVKKRSLHVFFEDIVVVYGCRGEERE